MRGLNRRVKKDLRVLKMAQKIRKVIARYLISEF
jgi:hypothetical protein